VDSPENKAEILPTQQRWHSVKLIPRYNYAMLWTLFSQGKLHLFKQLSRTARSWNNKKKKVTHYFKRKSITASQ
jgi:hypothetical protein